MSARGRGKMLNLEGCISRVQTILRPSRLTNPTSMPLSSSIASEHVRKLASESPHAARRWPRRFADQKRPCSATSAGQGTTARALQSYGPNANDKQSRFPPNSFRWLPAGGRDRTWDEAKLRHLLFPRKLMLMHSFWPVSISPKPRQRPCPPMRPEARDP